MTWLNETSGLPVRRRHVGTLQSRDNLFGLMDDFFREWGSVRAPVFPEKFIPALSVSETPNSYLVETELPGVKKEDVKIDFDDGILTISGEKKSFNEEKKDQYHRFERAHGAFTRSVKFPTHADPEKVSARMEDGVLRIEIAKAADAEKKRTIAIA